MDWQTIRNYFPNRWVLVEAVNAHTEKGKRIIEELKLVEAFDSDHLVAWNCYQRWHDQDRWKEYYVVHTANEQLNIGVMDSRYRVLDGSEET
jgi:uncharacterized protein YraI